MNKKWTYNIENNTFELELVSTHKGYINISYVYNIYLNGILKAEQTCYTSNYGKKWSFISFQNNVDKWYPCPMSVKKVYDKFFKNR